MTIIRYLPTGMFKWSSFNMLKPLQCECRHIRPTSRLVRAQPRDRDSAPNVTYIMTIRRSGEKTSQSREGYTTDVAATDRHSHGQQQARTAQTLHAFLMEGD